MPERRRSAERHQDSLLSYGIALVQGLSESEFVALMKGLGPIYMHPDADPDGVTRIVPDGRKAKVGGGFTAHALAVHTDRAVADVTPRYVGAYFVNTDPVKGGHPLFCQMDLALSTLPTSELKSLWLQGQDSNERHSVYLGRWDKYDRFRFRDDAHFRLDGPANLVKTVRDRISALTFPVPWLATGDAYIVDNTRVLHGRTEFKDPHRSIARVLIGPGRIR